MMKRNIALLGSFIIFAAFVAACATPTPEVIVETVEVEVPGETIVETVEVEVPTTGRQSCCGILVHRQ
jgi:L-cysteine desulfidase